MSIYVEIRIGAPVDEVWRLSQTPALHERWDLRFTSITYLERAESEARQRFRYATRLGGLAIEGWGETAGERSADGARTSALRFGSEDPRSLIRAGSGYWKYESAGDGMRFITGYDYEVRGGPVGRLLDRLAFRPLMGWATAWSFDRLRLWIERGVEPGGAARRALAHALAALAVAFVWVWHGLVPKLILAHQDELALLREAGVRDAWLLGVTRGLGAAEVAFGLAFVPLARRRWPWALTIALMVAATAAVVIIAPERALGADFERLHPRIQERFSLSSDGGRAAIGRGTMEEVWHGAFYTLPFLYVGTWRNIMFPDRGREVPFQIENWAYRDSLGRETVTWLRTFRTGRERRFDAYMIFSEARGRIVDYLGTHQHLAVDLELSVDERGGLRLRSGEQRFYEGPLAFRFPMLFSGVADVCEWFDDVSGRYRIEVNVTNRVFGPLFGYRGAFDVEWRAASAGVPSSARPARDERRE